MQHDGGQTSLQTGETIGNLHILFFFFLYLWQEHISHLEASPLFHRWSSDSKCLVHVGAPFSFPNLALEIHNILRVSCIKLQKNDYPISWYPEITLIQNTEGNHNLKNCFKATRSCRNWQSWSSTSKQYNKFIHTRHVHMQQPVAQA